MKKPKTPVLFDITSKYHKGNPESRAANLDVLPHKPNLREKVFTEIIRAKREGITCEEVEKALDMKHQTASARISELKRSGHIRIIGKRSTESGSMASVYVARKYEL
jgi:predicted HTH transcriptional regulator